MDKKEEVTKICPKCNSIKVFVDSSNPLMGALGLPVKYVCGDCGYLGSFFPEIKISELKNIKRKNISPQKDKTEKVDISYGRFLVSFWKIAGPLALITAIIILFISFQPKICEEQYVNDTDMLPGYNVQRQITVCSPDETRIFDKGYFISGILNLLVSIFMIYVGYFRGLKNKDINIKKRTFKKYLNILKE